MGCETAQSLNAPTMDAVQWKADEFERQYGNRALLEAKRIATGRSPDHSEFEINLNLKVVSELARREVISQVAAAKAMVSNGRTE